MFHIDCSMGAFDSLFAPPYLFVLFLATLSLPGETFAQVSDIDVSADRENSDASIEPNVGREDIPRLVSEYEVIHEEVMSGRGYGDDPKLVQSEQIRQLSQILQDDPGSLEELSGVSNVWFFRNLADQIRPIDPSLAKTIDGRRKLMTLKRVLLFILIPMILFGIILMAWPIKGFRAKRARQMSIFKMAASTTIIGAILVFFSYWMLQRESGLIGEGLTDFGFTLVLIVCALCSPIACGVTIVSAVLLMLSTAADKTAD